MSAVGKDKLKGRRKKPTIYNSNKLTKTGYIQGWHSLSEADHEKVKAKRVRKRAAWKTVQSNKDNTSNSNCMKQLVKQNKKYKQQIKSLKRSTTDNSNTDNSTNNDDEDADAGDQFGGRTSKKRGRRSNSSHDCWVSVVSATLFVLY